MSTSLIPPPNLRSSRGKGERATLKKDVNMALATMLLPVDSLSLIMLCLTLARRREYEEA